ncbi:hypothetical protein A3A38_01900 [Candidatus Kaiserbacteria bacterium RIFCSPLOWO2_01_FULL_53_17]|uniref:Uncharacterized protein n=1 Tax=Candidatus Kaiserbacteria bacterium RIFCSPLOWO2_01_FULL_53_17 TaxID=1798511 RepID=A0A1F6EHG6_9BACT|nr:MAG: hypothetical protein A3A38_01900 [Candidatus Kaiserbacteria bacterium RIFCSPLOWO2_01_FULL_53_17]
MINLIPNEEKRLVYKERLARAIVVFLAEAALLFTAGALLVAPSVLLVATKESAGEERLALLKKTTPVFQEKDALLQNVRAVQGKIIVLEKNDFFEVSPLVTAVLAMDTGAIRLSGFFYEQKKGKSGTATNILTVTGEAGSREALVSFTRALDESPLFSEVSLPVGTLVQSSAIPFSLPLTLSAAALTPTRSQ